LPRALSASGQALIGANSRFAFDLLRKVSEHDTASNVFLSPLSASMALDRSVDMRLANSIWVREGFPLHDAFVQSSRQSFDAKVSTLASSTRSWVCDHGSGPLYCFAVVRYIAYVR
jgi:serine protease inhibitor